MFQPVKRVIRNFRLLVIVTATGFVLAGLFSLNLGADYQLKAGCVLTVTSSHSSDRAQTMCPMKVGEHLAWWTHTFTGLPGVSPVMNLLALFASLMVIGLVLASFDPYTTFYARFRHGSQDPPDHNFRDYFTLFLAAGKAQPLVYA